MTTDLLGTVWVFGFLAIGIVRVVAMVAVAMKGTGRRRSRRR